MLPDSARLLYFSKRRNNGGGVSFGGGVASGWSVYVVWTNCFYRGTGRSRATATILHRGLVVARLGVFFSPDAFFFTDLGITVNYDYPMGRYLRPDVFNQSGQGHLLALLLYSGLHALLGR